MFLLHPGRFSDQNFELASEPDLIESVNKYTRKQSPSLCGTMSNNVENEMTSNHFCSSSANLPIVAIVVPYRNRPSHLRSFLPYMDQFLQRQGLNYTIIIMEQDEKKLFNRAKLLNAGYKETINIFPGVDCFIFHDVDLLPSNDENPYTCLQKPRHM